MKTKFKLSCLFLAALMLFSLTACGKDNPEPSSTSEGTEQTKPPVEAGSGTTIHTNLWDLTYDEADGWVYEEDDFYDNDDYVSISMSIPKEGTDTNLVIAEIYVSIEDPGDFRDYLTSYGFDEYEYAVNQAYEFTPVGGIDCLKAEGNYWGSPCLRYFGRVEGASATVLIQIIGEYEDERVDKLLSGLTINLEDTGNEDGPWYWEGEPFSTQPHSAMVGTYTVSSQWLPITDCIITKETFNHAAAVIGDKAFLLVDGALKRYDYDGTSLTFAEDIALDGDYEAIFADTAGTIWLSNFMEPLISWKDGAKTASYEGPDYVAMHPSVFKEVDLISHLLIDENHIYVTGSAADESGHKVFVYDTAGNLQLTLADSDGGSLGSVTFVAETANGYLALDGNMREVVLWTKDGTYIGAAEDSDLFGTSYPWFCGGTSYPWFCGGVKLADGSILAIMTEDRADESAMELVAFKLSGF